MPSRCWHARRVLSDWCWRLCSNGAGCLNLQDALKFECACLDPWVSSRTVVAFILLDIVCCVVFLVLFLRHKALGKLWLPDFGWKVLAAILIFRLLCDLLGIYSVLRRNVSQVRCYYFLVVVHFLLTFVLARPLLLADCACFESAMGLVHLDSRNSLEESRQCDVWHSFFEVGDVTTRRLAEKWPRCKQLIPGRDEGERREGLGVPVPDLFKVVDFGIKLEGRSSDCVDLDLSIHLGSALEHMRCSFYDMFDWMSTPFRALHKELQQCFAHRSCGGVGIVLDPALSGLDDSCGNITVCRHTYPVLPSLATVATNPVCTVSPVKRCPIHLQLYLLKDVEKFECFRFGKVSGPATQLCKFAVQGALCLLLFLDIVTIPAFTVIRKYLRNNCGDFIEDDVQFDVDEADIGRPSFASSEASFVAGAHAPSDGASYSASWRRHVPPGATEGVELTGVAR